MTRLGACGAALTLVLAGCVSRPAAQAENFVGPRLISCDASLTTASQQRTGQGVVLEYTVNANGRVDPQTIKEHRNGIVHPSGAAVNIARQIAASCTYYAGTLNGKPTAVTIRESFTIDVAQ
jgi:hypothetical protein